MTNNNEIVTLDEAAIDDVSGANGFLLIAAAWALMPIGAELHDARAPTTSDEGFLSL